MINKITQGPVANVIFTLIKSITAVGTKAIRSPITAKSLAPYAYAHPCQTQKKRYYRLPSATLDLSPVLISSLGLIRPMRSTHQGRRFVALMPRSNGRLALWRQTDETDRFHRSARQVRAEAAKRLKGVSTETDTASVSSKDKSEVKLPRLELPKYSGDLTEWQSFCERFDALVDQSELPVISKFSYLQSLLQGEALTVIQGLAPTSANYKVACELLKERFGRPERIIFAYVQGLLNDSFAPRSKGTYVESSWKLQDQLLRHVRSLEALCISGDQYGVVLTSIILSRLLQDMKLEWSRESAGHESDLEWLVKFLQMEIQRHERSETFKELSMEKNVRQEAERKRVSSALALQTSSEEGSSWCAFCQKRQPSEQCWQILRLKSTVLQTAKVKVLTGGGKCAETVVLFDLGTDNTYGNNLSVIAVEVMSICPPLRHQKVPDDIFQSFSHLKLAEDYGHDRDLTLDILTGVDYYWRFIKADTIVRFEDLVAHESVFGYILSGSCRRAHEESMSHQLLCFDIANNGNESNLHKFCLESVGINVEKDNPPKDPVLDTFEGTIEYVNGRYDVAFP
ncbi:uncharacterized protein [Macrobrachium rosenbergii]|uniref:uncharacterized protein n=1 Tax=Macrobrachium rosenbergii TaxID=79674 RepID=UPI0034D44572